MKEKFLILQNKISFYLFYLMLALRLCLFIREIGDLEMEG